MVQQEIIKILKNILGTFAYEYGTDSQSYNELEKLALDLESQEGQGDEVGEETKIIEPVETGDLKSAEQDEPADKETDKENQQFKHNKKQKRG